MNVYTLGTWVVAPGRDDEFVEAWHDLVRERLDPAPYGSGSMTIANQLGRSKAARARFAGSCPSRDLLELRASVLPRPERVRFSWPLP